MSRNCLKQEHEVECPEITKRTIGKAIVTFCGNEGTEDDANKAGLRRLLQAVISETENKTRQVLKDAEIVVYDDQFQKYAIRAGDGKAKFLATFDEKGIPRVIRTYNLK